MEICFALKNEISIFLNIFWNSRIECFLSLVHDPWGSKFHSMNVLLIALATRLIEA